MKVEYIYNSSFLIETDNHQFLIDYYRGNFRLNPDKPCTFIVTHAHADHFDPVIFNYAREGDQFLLSNDTAVPAQDTVHLLEPGNHYTFGDVKIQTCGSTDAGLSIRVEVDGVNFLHAGDLNLWIWPEDSEIERNQMKADFLREVDCFDLKPRLDLALIPVDGRLEDRYLEGPLHYISTLRPRYVIPMHFREDWDVIKDFQRRAGNPGSRILIPTPEKTSFVID